MSFITFRDTLYNFLTGLGQQGIDPTQSTNYVLNLLDRATLENMYRGDWLARKIVDAPADDMTREWRSWQASQDQIEKIETVEKAMDLRRKIKQWVIKARLYGGSALIIGVDDGNDPSQEIDLSRCGAGCLKYVVVLHRFELNAGPRIYNVTDPYYTRAAYYTVATPMFGFYGEGGVTSPMAPGSVENVPGSVNQFFGKVIPFRGKKPPLNWPATTPTNIGMTQIHPSRVLELPGNELPDWRLAPLGGGWGDSVLQTVVDTAKAFTTIQQGITAMVNDGKMDVVKVPEFAIRIQNPDYKQKLIDRFTLSVQSKSVISALLLDKEEEWNRITTQYAGLPMILHEFITLVSGAAAIPVSRLFGQASGRGLSGGSTGSSGESDLRNYYDECSNKQKNDVAPRLGMLDQVIMRSALGREDPNVHYNWNPLWSISDSDKAKDNFVNAQATQIYAGLGLINEDALREGVVNQLIEDGVYPGLDNAIEEFGAEPEEPDMTGGYLPPGEPVGDPGSQSSPNPDELNHTGELTR
jgi:hypothetical protein